MASQTTGLYNITKKFALPQWRWYLSGVITLAMTTFITLKVPELSKDVINGLIESKDLSEFKVVCIAIIILGFGQIIVRAISRVLLFWPGRKLEANIKEFYFSKFLKLPQYFFEKFGMGDLISRLTNDIGQLRALFAFALLQFLNLSFLLVFTISKMLNTHVTLTLYCLIPLVLIVVVAKFGIPKMHAYSKVNQRAVGQLTNKITESFINVHVIQANSANDSFINKIHSKNVEVYDSVMKVVFIRMVIFPLMSLLAGFSFLVVLFYGGKEVIEGRLTVGDIMAFNVYLGLLSFPLTAMGFVASIYQRAKAASERLSELEEEEEEKASIVSSSKLIQPDRNKIPMLEVKNLTFNFGSNSKTPQVLKNVSFEIFEGERIGLCGAVGSGKTTLFNLISRIYNPPEGTIFWKGKDVLSIDPEDLRKEMGYALQSVHLFSSSVEDNLLLGKRTSINQKNALDAASKAAQIYDDIVDLDKGWETEIGEKGVRLSGGQKQRLSLARIFMGNPSIYLLDDVTSALDHSTEQKIINHIQNSNQSMIIASHRSSALQGCKEIILLDEGGIIARGSLEELRKSHGYAFLAE